jgi:hypothetical protein
VINYNHIGSNKSHNNLKTENQTLTNRMQKLQSEAKVLNKYKEGKNVKFELDRDVFKERKELIEFMFKNDGKMVLFTPAVREMI